MSSVLLPTLLLVIAATLLAVGMLVVGALIGPQRSSAVKEMPYESGMDPIHDARRRFDVRFHLVAIAFLVFDVELLFLYPWAVANRAWLAWLRPSEHPDRLASVAAAAQAAHVNPNLVFAEIMVFMALLTVGYIYAWRKGVFRW
jgi:NADH-quinone oxidoreductase subunit A